MSNTRVDITCPHCRRVYRLRVDLQRLADAQTTARCGRCGKRFGLRKRVHDSGIVATPIVQAARETGPPRGSAPAHASTPPGTSSPPLRSRSPERSQPPRFHRRAASSYPPGTSPPPPPSGPGAEGTRFVPTDPPPAEPPARPTPPPRRKVDTDPMASPPEGTAAPRTSPWARGESSPPKSTPRQDGPSRQRVTAPPRRSHSLESLPFEREEVPRELPSIAEPLSPIDRRRRRPRFPSDPPPEPQPIAHLRRRRTAPQMAAARRSTSSSRNATTEPAMRAAPAEAPPQGPRSAPSIPVEGGASAGNIEPVGGDVGPGWLPLDEGYAEELTPTPSDAGLRDGVVSRDAWVNRADPGLDALHAESSEGAAALRWLLVDDRPR